MEEKNSRPRKKKSTKKVRYRPDRLFDTLLKQMKLNSDAELSRVLGVVPAVISKTRNKLVPVSAGLLVRIHEVSELSIQELRRLMGDKRLHYSSYKAVTGEKEGKQRNQRKVSMLRKNHSSGCMVKTDEGKGVR